MVGNITTKSKFDHFIVVWIILFSIFWRWFILESPKRIVYVLYAFFWSLQSSFLSNSCLQQHYMKVAVFLFFLLFFWCCCSSLFEACQSLNNSINLSNSCFKSPKCENPLKHASIHITKSTTLKLIFKMAFIVY